MGEKPLPSIDPDNKPLFQGYQDRKFQLYRWQQCGDWYWPKSFCRNHKNEPHFENIELEEASGIGEIFAFIVNHRDFHPGFSDNIPYTFALIKLKEEPMFGSQIINISPAAVEIGMSIEVDFVDVPAEKIPQNKRKRFPLEGGFTLPYFSPIEEVNA